MTPSSTVPSLRSLRKAWRQAKSSPFLLPVRRTKGGRSAPREIHRVAAALFVPTKLGECLQVLAFPGKWLRGNVSSARRLPSARRGKYEWLRLLPKGLWETAVHNFEPSTWYSYGLWRRQGAVSREAYVTHREICALLPHLNSRTDTAFLAHKIPFWKFCREHQLPCAPIIVVASQGRIEWQSAASELPPTDLFVKVEGLYCGIGAERWEWQATDSMWHRRGVAKTRDEFLAHVLAVSQSGSALVQPRLRNHPALAPYTNGSLATLRVVTSRVPGKEPKVMATCLRMPTGENEVDNFAAGGLAAAVLPGGLVRSAVAKANPLEPVASHPDSGFHFEGTTLPLFSEALQLCLQAHGLFEKPCFVGWDVAFLDSGPVLLEANTTWCVDLLQMSHGVPVGDLGFIDDYLRCLE